MGTLAPALRAAILVAVVLAACADTAAEPRATDPTLPPTAVAPTTTEPPPPTIITTTTTTTTLTPTTTTTLAPTTTLPPPTTTSTTTTSTTTLTSTTSTAAAEPPPETSPTHGGFSWAVYLGHWDSPPEAAAFDEAVAPARAVGYDIGGWSDAGCDQGAAAALGFDPAGDHTVAALYFATEADARAAAAAIGDGVDAVAEVQTYCLD